MLNALKKSTNMTIGITIALFLFLFIMGKGEGRFWHNLGMVLMSKRLSEQSVDVHQVEKLNEDWGRVEKIFTKSSKHNNRSNLFLGFVALYERDESRADLFWKTSSETAPFLIEWGKLEQKRGNTELALIWFERAVKANSSLRDGWYYIGDILFQLDRYTEALSAFSNAAQAEEVEIIGLSEIYYRIGVIYQNEIEAQDIDNALRMYDKALAIDDFTFYGTQAELYHKRGIIYEKQGRDLQEAISEYRRAINLVPDHAWAHLRLGFALYRLNGDIEESSKELYTAIEVWPSDSSRKWPHRVLGNMYNEAQLPCEAMAQYREALQFDPADEDILIALEQLLTQNKCE